MTTIIASNKQFIAGDSLWTNRQDEPVNKTLRKYVSINEEITYFSGDEYPILFEQAQIFGFISEATYLELQTQLDENEQFASIVFEMKDGRFLKEESSGFECLNSIIHSGSGGENAAQFYINQLDSDTKQRIDNAMNFTFALDPCSGGHITKTVWESGTRLFDNTQITDLNYEQEIKNQIEYLLDIISKYNDVTGGSTMSATLVSPSRTSPTVNAPKVDIELAKKRLAARKARLAKKATEEKK